MQKNGQATEDMKLDYPGLMKERLKSGAFRYRVRPAGKPQVKIRLHVAPDHPNFRTHYHAARQGIQMDPEPESLAQSIPGSIGWLVDQYTAAIRQMRDDDQMHPSTVHQRTVFLEWLRSEVGEYSLNMPQSQLIKLRDKKAATPGAADNFIKTVRAMYSWACDRGKAKANPAVGIARLNRGGGGATAWRIEDLQQYRERHPQGTMAHLALTLFMFTAGRIGDVYRLGRQHEVRRNGIAWLDWQPEKKGSRRVQIPMLPPLERAIRSMTVLGPTYLLTDLGKPFASKNAFGNKFADWVEQAGLTDRSSHGIRKAAGELLALEGASQYHIMSVHGHASAKTSEIYTQGAERAKLAQQAMSLLSGMQW